MIESTMWKALIATLEAGLLAESLSDVVVRQAYQPRSQGASVERSAYLHKVTSQRVGVQGRSAVWNPAQLNFTETDKYWLAQTMQLTVQAEQNIADQDSLTAYDIAERCAAILQTRQTRDLLLAAGISIQKITDVRDEYALDDLDQFDINPSFDFILLYEQTLTSTVPGVSAVEADIKRV
jgi:hypothetical protein